MKSLDEGIANSVTKPSYMVPALHFVLHHPGWADAFSSMFINYIFEDDKEYGWPVLAPRLAKSKWASDNNFCKLSTRMVGQLDLVIYDSDFDLLAPKGKNAIVNSDGESPLAST